MKRFLCFSAAGLLWVAPILRAQDGVTPLPSSSSSPAPSSAAAIASRQDAEENYNLLKGHVDDLIAAQAERDKQIQDLKKQIEELRLQLTKPSGNFASQDDLKQLATAVQEIDKKREADKDLILKEIEKLGQTVSGGGSTSSHPSHSTPATSSSSSSTSSSTPNPDQSGFYYTIKANDTVGLIAQAYREKGLKVSTKQIQDANPNVNPAKLRVGMKIFIPAPKGTTLN